MTRILLEEKKRKSTVCLWSLTEFGRIKKRDYES